MVITLHEPVTTTLPTLSLRLTHPQAIDQVPRVPLLSQRRHRLRQGPHRPLQGPHNPCRHWEECFHQGRFHIRCLQPLQGDLEVSGVLVGIDSCAVSCCVARDNGGIGDRCVNLVVPVAPLVPCVVPLVPFAVPLVLWFWWVGVFDYIAMWCLWFCCYGGWDQSRAF